LAAQTVDLATVGDPEFRPARAEEIVQWFGAQAGAQGAASGGRGGRRCGEGAGRADSPGWSWGFYTGSLTV